MSLIAQSITLARKDLRVLAQTSAALGSVYVLGVLLVVVPALGIGSVMSPGGSISLTSAVPIFWTAYLFASVLCVERTMRIEVVDGAIDALCMAPASLGAIFLGKFLTNVLLLVPLVIVVTIAGVVLMNVDFSIHISAFCLIVTLGMIGVAAVGTLLSAGLAGAGLRTELMALVSLPLLLPMVLLANRLFERQVESQESGLVMSGIGLLIAADVVYLAAGFLAFEIALEDSNP